MAEPIKHDGLSVAATVGTKAVKYGVIGVLAAVGGGALIGGAVGALGLGLLAAPFAGGLAAGLSGTAAVVGAIIGGVIGAFGGASVGSTAAIAGGALGVIKGGDQVSRENAQYRNRGHNHQQMVAKKYNDGEVKGIQEGYQIARADMEPMIQQREQAAFQKGQEAVVQQIQDHMNAQMQAAGAHSQREIAKGGGITLQCEAKAKAVLQKREFDAAQPKELH